jgi:hypothetical protein
LAAHLISETEEVGFPLPALNDPLLFYAKLCDLLQAEEPTSEL